MKPSQLLTLIAACSITSAAADTYTVKNTNPSGVDSFSQAVMDANGHPNIDADTPDLVVFAIPASDPNRDPATGVFTIALPTTLTGVGFWAISARESSSHFTRLNQRQLSSIPYPGPQSSTLSIGTGRGE